MAVAADRLSSPPDRTAAVARPTASPLSPSHSPAPRPTHRAGLTAKGATLPQRRAAGVPVRLQIPAIGVDTALERLGTERDGELAPPRNPDLAGWFAAGPRPGDLGPSVIAGHVDSTSGPAVFWRLRELRRGDRVSVRDRSGRAVTFRVTQVRQVSKGSFPTEAVYGPTPDAALRLVTCGGVYVRGSGGYQDNVLVYAVLA